MEPGTFSGLKSAGGIRSLWLSAYMASASPSCRRLFVQLTRKARFLALLNAGNNMPARIAMMAMTTSSSIKVKAEFRFINLTGFGDPLAQDLVFKDAAKETV